MRDVQSRHKGLPPRTPDMLYNIVRKFYRGAVSHYDLIQEKKQDVRAAWQRRQATGEDAELRQALHTLFLEFHFYVTCWLQIEMAMFRLARQEESQARVLESFRPELERHLSVREQLDQTEASVEAQLLHGGPEWSCVQRDAYWFDGIAFTVDEHSLQTLQALYEAIQQARIKQSE
ncbi:hypothetical protein [Brevibacillus choshinensis]|uniref:Uncharacterized protein n=1 Tax=Brevibacillus choshinensis TaxID=54911 RepID=A0ABX7FT81_BRECH|nr:hypothetical protein [Brevibacillus choshinensis]QRG68933.1 hypothetical protein JNE38_07270 [Brevibacillus choshinensis]